MKRFLALVVVLAAVVVSGCSSSTNASVWRFSAGVDTRAHSWETPHFESGDGAVDVGAGVISIKAHGELNDHDPNGKWISFDFGAKKD